MSNKSKYSRSLFLREVCGTVWHRFFVWHSVAPKIVAVPQLFFSCCLQSVDFQLYFSKCGTVARWHRKTQGYTTIFAKIERKKQLNTL